MSTSDTDFNVVETLEGVDNDTDLDQFSADFFGEKEAGADDAKTAAEELDDASKDDAHVEDDTLAEDASKKDEEQDEPEPKPKKNRTQERIEELNAKYRQEQREKQELQRKLDELENARQNKETKTAAPTAEGPAPDDVNEDGTEKYPLGEFDPGYIRDLTRFTIKQERQAAEAVAKEQAEKNQVVEAQTALVEDWNAKLPQATEKYPDFLEKGEELIESFTDLDESYGAYLTETLMSMEFGTDVLYYLASHPDEARDIVNSGARQATIRLGRLESKFAKAEEVTEPRRVSSAPPPPPANKGSAVARVSVAPDTDNLADFEKIFFKKRG